MNPRASRFIVGGGLTDFFDSLRGGEVMEFLSDDPAETPIQLDLEGLKRTLQWTAT
ncbi:MAG: hypothetical protein JW394_0598 [Nitrospira sp.]|nr:hypothetical protein [Nitrospira sp.]